VPSWIEFLESEERIAAAREEEVEGFAFLCPN